MRAAGRIDFKKSDDGGRQNWIKCHFEGGRKNCITGSEDSDRQNWRKNIKDGGRQNLRTDRRMAAGRTGVPYCKYGGKQT